MSPGALLRSVVFGVWPQTVTTREESRPWARAAANGLYRLPVTGSESSIPGEADIPGAHKF